MGSTPTLTADDFEYTKWHIQNHRKGARRLLVSRWELKGGTMLFSQMAKTAVSQAYNRAVGRRRELEATPTLTAVDIFIEGPRHPTKRNALL